MLQLIVALPLRRYKLGILVHKGQLQIATQYAIQSPVVGAAADLVATGKVKKDASIPIVAGVLAIKATCESLALSIITYSEMKAPIICYSCIASSY